MKAIDILNKIEKKPIFVCSEQTVDGIDEVPKCEYVKIDFQDWNDLREAIIKQKE